MAKKPESPHSDLTGSPESPRRKARWKRVIRLTILGLVVVLALVVVFGPSIASSIAPGYIESAVNKSIDGSVKVNRLKLGWFSDTAVGPVEVADSKGREVAKLSLAAPISVWRVLSERMWNATALDLGTIEVSGTVSLVTEADGKTNLEKAVGAKGGAKPAAPKQAAAPSPIKSIKAALKITQLDVSLKERKADNTFGPEYGLKQVAGSASVNYDTMGGAGQASVDAKADIAGAPVFPPPALGAPKSAATPTLPGPFTLKLAAAAKQKKGTTAFDAGTLDNATIKLNATGAPVAILDAIASMGGALASGLGDKADISIDAAGNLDAATAKLNVDSPGMQAAFDVTIKDSVLTASTAPKSNRVFLKSTQLLANLPQTKQAVAQASQRVQLSQAPSLELQIDSLRLPIPKSLFAVAKDASGKPVPFNASMLDMHAASIVAHAKISETSGRVALADEPATAGAAPPTSPVDWKDFTVQPLELAINIPDFSQPVHIAAATTATLDSRSAGELALEVTASGLTDSQGHLRALAKPASSLAEQVDAQVRLRGVSTALLQPFLAGLNLPIELKTDAGPTLDLALTAKTQGVGAASADALPPTDLALNVTSANLKADATARLDKGQLVSTGNGFIATITSAAPLVQRILAKPGAAGTASPLTISGAGRVDVAAKDFTIPLDFSKLKSDAPLAALNAAATVTILDLGATVSLAQLNAPNEPALGGRGVASPAPLPPGPSSAPVSLTIDRASTTVRFAPGNAPAIDMTAALRHNNAPFTATGAITFEGLKAGKLPEGSDLTRILDLKTTGSIEVKDIPRALLSAVPGLDTYLTEPTSGSGTSDDLNAKIARAARSAIGDTLTLTLNFSQGDLGPGEGQVVRVRLATAADSLAADIWTRVSPSQAAIPAASISFNAEPKAINPILASLAAPPPAPAADKSRAPAPPPELAGPVKVIISTPDPISIPLAQRDHGLFNPAWSAAKDAFIRIVTNNDIAINNVTVAPTTPNGDPSSTTVRLHALQGDIQIPLAAMAIKSDGSAKERPMHATLHASLLTGGAGAATQMPIANFRAEYTAALNGSSPDSSIYLSDIDTAALEPLIGARGMLKDSLGDKADLTIRSNPTTAAAPAAAPGAPPSPAPLIIRAELTAPLLTGSNLVIRKDADRISLAEPASIVWKPRPEFLNTYLNPPPSAAAAAKTAAAPAQPLRVTAAAPVSITLSKFVIAIPKSETDPKTGGTRQVIGPFKPGVFELDAQVTSPSLALLVPQPATKSAKGAAPAATTPETLPITLEGIHLAIRRPDLKSETASLDADLGIDRVGGAGTAGAGAAQKSTAKAQITNLADAAGVLTPDKAAVNLDADVTAFPTQIVDRIAGQNGLLTVALGPTVSLNAKANNVSKSATAAGNLDARATSQRITAELKGDIKNSQFIQTGATKMKILDIRPELADRLSGSLPTISTLEKSTQDKPGSIDATNLTAPLAGDLTMLNGDVVVDLGEARFTIQPMYGEFIKGIGSKSEGQIGQRLEPFTVHMARGVLTYDRFKVPLGEFIIETRGTVDLVQREIDVITYVPLFGLTDKAAGMFNTSISGKLGVLDKSTMLPFRTHGSLDHPKVEPDLGLFLKETGNNLLKEPGKIVNDVLDNILNKKKGGGK